MSSGISSTPKQAGHGSPFLSFSAVFGNYFLPERFDDLMQTSDLEQKKYSVLEGDIFLTRTSETIDELGMSSVAVKNYPNATYSGFLKRLRPTQKDVTYHKFMGFYLRSKLFRKAMTNNAVLTLRASLNEDIFSYLSLIIPEYNEQVKIGDLLYLLNQKIDLNNRINVELEKMAKTIYDYWFMQFDFPDENGNPYKTSGRRMIYSEVLKREIPLGWKVVQVKDLADTSSGGTPLSTKREYYYNGTIPWINSGELNSPFIVRGSSFITELGLNNSSTKIFPVNTVLVALYGATAGKVSLLRIEACTNQAVCGLLTKSQIYTNFLKYGLENLYNHMVILSSGSARDNLSQDIIKSIIFAAPQDENIFKKFNNIVNPMLEKIVSNLLESQTLSEMRDWLLPMLMNGQVKVK